MRLKLSFQGWVLAGCLLVVACTLVFVGVLTERSLHSWMLAQVQSSYRGEMALLRELLRQRWPARADLASLDELADNLGRILGVRVTIITRQGRVMGDSRVERERLARLDNHAGRPEVAAALVHGRGKSIRRSATLGLDLMYLAALVRPPGSPPVVIRLAVPLAQVDRILSRLRRLVVQALVLGVLLSLGVAYLVARGISRPVRQLTSTAVTIADGDLSQRFRRYPSHEIGRLGRAFDRMADNLQARIAEATRARDTLASILWGMGEGVLVSDRQGRVILANRALRQLLGLERDPEGEQVSEVIRLPELLEAMQAMRRGAGRRRVELQTRGQSPRWLEVNLVQLRQGGQAAGVVAVFHDISERKRTEQVLKDFVANVSHELRTPLSAIRGAAETLLDGALAEPEQARRFAQIISRQVLRMENLAVDLLSLARLESGESAPVREEIRAGELVSSAGEAVEALARDKGVTLELEPPEPDFGFRADRGQVEQALYNLMDNAVKYTPAGGRVRLEILRRAGQVVLEVSDTGIGIDRQHLARLFQRFYRVDRQRSRHLGGTGLGLAIVKHIAMVHGGRVEVESTPGQGSIFRLVLPDA